jgi:hypothetical protein
VSHCSVSSFLILFFGLYLGLPGSPFQPCFPVKTVCAFLLSYLKFDIHGSLHRRWLSRNTNKMQLCNRIYYSKVYWVLNMFRAAHRSSSGALNCICSLWFIYTCGDRPLSGLRSWQWLVTTCVHKPEAANTVQSSWWWAVCRSKHVEPSVNFGIINSIKKLHLVGISTELSYLNYTAEYSEICHPRADTCERCCNIYTLNGNLDLRDLKFSKRHWLFKCYGIWRRTDLKIMADVSEVRASSIFILRLSWWWRQKASPRSCYLYWS